MELFSNFLSKIKNNNFGFSSKQICILSLFNINIIIIAVENAGQHSDILTSIYFFIVENNSPRTQLLIQRLLQNLAAKLQVRYCHCSFTSFQPNSSHIPTKIISRTKRFSTEIKFSLPEFWHFSALLWRRFLTVTLKFLHSFVFVFFFQFLVPNNMQRVSNSEVR